MESLQSSSLTVSTERWLDSVRIQAVRLIMLANCPEAGRRRSDVERGRARKRRQGVISQALASSRRESTMPRTIDVLRKFWLRPLLAGRPAMLCLCLAVPLLAQSSPWSADDTFQWRAPSELTLHEAASRAQEAHGGELIAIRAAEQDGHRGWQATLLLDNGRVKTLFVEKRSGAVVERRQ